MSGWQVALAHFDAEDDDQELTMDKVVQEVTTPGRACSWGLWRCCEAGL